MRTSEFPWLVLRTVQQYFRTCLAKPGLNPIGFIRYLGPLSLWANAPSATNRDEDVLALHQLRADALPLARIICKVAQESPD